MDFKEHVNSFLKLLDDFHVVEFLKRDTCGALCDKYHLIIIFQFFMRAEFKEEDYTVRNFFLALTLSHDLYDESKIMKNIIQAFYLSRKDGFHDKSKSTFHWDKLVLFQRMKFKGFMEKKICQKLCQLIQHRAFYKNRKEIHTGIISVSVFCEKCLCPVSQKCGKTDENSDKRETSCNKVSNRKQNRKRPREDSSERNLFFPDLSHHSPDEKNIVTSVC